MKRTLINTVLVMLVIVSIGAIWYGMRGIMTAGDVPMTPAPTASSVAATVVKPTDQATIASEATQPADDAVVVSPAPTTPSKPVMDDIASTPVHVEIRHSQTVLIQAQIVSIQLNDRGEINPPSGKAGWYGPPQWNTVPGNLSEHPAVLAAHVTYGGQRDVFYRLSETKKGDRVIVTYASGVTAEFIVDNDPVSVGKDDVVVQGSDYDWVWQLDQPGRVISIITCDPSLGRDLSGHSYNNWVVQATRVN